MSSLRAADPLGLPMRSLLSTIAVVFAAAALAAVANLQAAPFYEALRRPAWAPPATVFGPVWSVLYLLMAVAMWLVWRLPPSGARRTAARLFALQLGLNVLWSWLFFRIHSGGGAFVDVVLLWCTVAATAFVFWRLRPLASVLLWPYLAWVSFALCLNLSVWRLNPSILGTG
jgi:translocator protein